MTRKKVYTIDTSGGIGSTFPDQMQSVQKVVGHLQGPSRALGGGAGGQQFTGDRSQPIKKTDIIFNPSMQGPGGLNHQTTPTVQHILAAQQQQ